MPPAARERAGLRERALTGAGSARTPGIVADLALGLKLFLDFALSAGALDAADPRRPGPPRLGGAAGGRRGAGGTHSGRRAHRPVSAPAGGPAIGTAAYVAGPDGREPRENPEAWGWRSTDLRRGDASARTGMARRRPAHRLGRRRRPVPGARSDLRRPRRSWPGIRGTGCPFRRGPSGGRLKDAGCWPPATRGSGIPSAARWGGHDPRRIALPCLYALSPCTRSCPNRPQPAPDRARIPACEAGRSRRTVDRTETALSGRDRPQEPPRNPGKTAAGDGPDGRLEGRGHPRRKTLPSPQAGGAVISAAVELLARCLAVGIPIEGSVAAA